MASGLHISINAEKVFDIAGISISNSIFTTWLVSIVIFLLAYKTYQTFTKVEFSDKPSRFQSLMEMIIESLFNLVQSIAGNQKKARAFFPIVSTFFIFILLSNWSGLIPGVGTIGFREIEAAQAEEVIVGESHEETITIEADEVDVEHEAVVGEATDEHQDETIMMEVTNTADQAEEAEHAQEEGEHSVFVPYFRGPTADLNTTLALAIFAMVTVQVIGFKFLGFNYSHKFLNLKSPIDFFVGFLEFFSEISKIISFAFRLFGNIFAGEVLLSVMAFLMPLLGPIPFLGLEVFVGFIQALVFSLLTLVFMNLATMGHGEEAH